MKIVKFTDAFVKFNNYGTSEFQSVGTVVHCGESVYRLVGVGTIDYIVIAESDLSAMVKEGRATLFESV